MLQINLLQYCTHNNTFDSKKYIFYFLILHFEHAWHVSAHVQLYNMNLIDINKFEKLVDLFKNENKKKS